MGIFVFIIGPLDVDAAEQYIRLKTPIDVREEGRIEIIKSSKCQKGKKGCWWFQYTHFQQCYICIKFLYSKLNVRMFYRSKYENQR